MKLHRVLKRALPMVLACALSSEVHAVSQSLLEVSGSGNTSQFIDVNQAVAVGFTLGQAYSNVSISADITCFGCSGQIVLMSGAIGPTATLANFVTSDVFNVSSPVDPLLTGLSLAAGDYYLIIAMTDQAAAGWIGSDAPVITSVAGVSAGLNYFALSLDNLSYNSDFLVILSSRGLHFSVVADVPNTTVPEPPPLWFLSGGLVLCLYRRWAK